MNYGCEVWGYHTVDDVEKVHISYLKRILKVRKSAVNYMVYCELGRFPMYIERYCRMLRYWFILLYTDNCILKCLYEDMFESSVVKPNDKLNWACKVRDILFKYGFHNIWISQYVNHVDFFLYEFKQRMKDNFISEMNTFFNESPKSHLYRYLFDNNVLQFYLDRPLNYIYKPCICEMRISAHNLDIETGRFYNLDRHERVCSMCNLNVVEDEYHFILQCEKYIDARGR